HVGTAEMIFVVVLMYGAGVDYSLMLVSRYRELLDAGLAAPQAAAESLDATLPAILASAGTNTVGLFMLTFATHGVFRTSGPVIAIALACALVAALTLVPAMLGAIGPALFWPSRRMGQIGSTRLWPAVAKATIARPALVLVATFVLLGIPAIRGANLEWVYDALTGLTRDYSARRGSEMAWRHWAEGETTPVRVLVETKAPLTESQWRQTAETITTRLAAWNEVSNIRSLTWPLGKGRPRFAPPVPTSAPAHAPTGVIETLAPYLPSVSHVADSVRCNEIFNEYVDTDRRAMHFDVVLKHPGFSLPALAAAEALPGRILSVLPTQDPPQIHLAGITAETLDVKNVTRRDVILIATLVLSVIFLMVLALLRDVLLSVFMIVSTLLSYLATLGLTYWIFRFVAGSGGLDWKVQIFLFVVMVAVGQDYNIYLAARLAQEALVVDTREAIRRAVVRTGPVISSCGVIMAATLGSLAVGDITLLTQLGVAMALGMLIDTFVVRPLLLPAFAALTGRTGRSRHKPVG
ncbi:MAG: MMPL family transporter, partial [Planctomycetota bacterium]